jgi:hypothetical protein
VSGWTCWLTSKVGFLWNRVYLIDEEDYVCDDMVNGNGLFRRKQISSNSARATHLEDS